jgi:hypothetical protein
MKIAPAAATSTAVTAAIHPSGSEGCAVGVSAVTTGALG